MNLILSSSSEVKNVDRFILDYIFNGYILTNKNYHDLSILNFDLEILQNVHIDEELVYVFHYFSQDHKHLLLYCGEVSCLYYIDLTQLDKKPLKLKIPKECYLTQYYFWHNNSFVIIDCEGRLFSYDIIKYSFQLVEQDLGYELKAVLKSFFEYINNYKILFFDVAHNIFIYRTLESTNHTLFWKNSSKKIDIHFKITLEDVYMADCIDEVMVLISDNDVVFYYLNKLIFKLSIRKNYRSYGGRLYKHQGKYYFLLLSSGLRDYRDTIIDLYKVEM